MSTTLTSNSFLEGVNSLTAEADNDLDQIVIDLFGFFMYLQNVFNTILQCRKLYRSTKLKNPKTRFSKMDKPSGCFDKSDITICQCKRIYFLTIVPQQKGFNLRERLLLGLLKGT